VRAWRVTIIKGYAACNRTNLGKSKSIIIIIKAKQRHTAACARHSIGRPNEAKSTTEALQVTVLLVEMRQTILSLSAGNNQIVSNHLAKTADARWCSAGINQQEMLLYTSMSGTR
jgi:hypothetical protein